MTTGAREQSAQAQQVATAAEEMSKTIVENAQNAATTADTAKEAKHAAEEGGCVVDDTI